MITIKSAKQVEKMRASAKVTKGALELLEKHIKPHLIQVEEVMRS